MADGVVPIRDTTKSEPTSPPQASHKIYREVSRIEVKRDAGECAKRTSQFLEELARRAGNINPAGNVALAVLHPLDDAGRLAALGAIGALGSVHHLLAVGCFSDLSTYGHGSFLLRLRSYDLALFQYLRSIVRPL